MPLPQLTDPKIYIHVKSRLRLIKIGRVDKALTETSNRSKSQGTHTPPDAKLTSAILHIIMEEVFRGAGAEVATNEVVAEVAARGICKVRALIYIYREQGKFKVNDKDLERKVCLNPKLQG